MYPEEMSMSDKILKSQISESLSVCVKPIQLIKLIRMTCSKYGLIESKKILESFCNWYDIKFLTIVTERDLISFFNLLEALSDGVIIFKTDNSFYPRDPQPLDIYSIKNMIG